jgi:hypothetical protein
MVVFAIPQTKRPPEGGLCIRGFDRLGQKCSGMRHYQRKNAMKAFTISKNTTTKVRKKGGPSGIA